MDKITMAISQAEYIRVVDELEAAKKFSGGML